MKLQFNWKALIYHALIFQIAEKETTIMFLQKCTAQSKDFASSGC